MSTLKVIRNKELLRNGHSQEETKEPGAVNAVRDLGWDPGAEQGHQVKTKEI